MARNFDGSAYNLSVDSAPVTAVPFTLACWFRCEQNTARDSLVTLADKDVTNHFFILGVDGGTAGDPVQARIQAGATVGTADSTTGYSLNTWHHAVGVFSANDSRTVYLDGGNSATDTTSGTPSNINRLGIGYLGDSTPSTYFDGYIAEVGVWNVALSTAEILALSKGYAPSFIRPDALVAYIPIIGNYSPEIDLVGGLSLTVTSAAKSNHPRIIYPSKKWLLDNTATGGGGGSSIDTFPIFTGSKFWQPRF